MPLQLIEFGATNPPPAVSLLSSNILMQILLFSIYTQPLLLFSLGLGKNCIDLPELPPLGEAVSPHLGTGLMIEEEVWNLEKISLGLDGSTTKSDAAMRHEGKCKEASNKHARS